MSDTYGTDDDHVRMLKHLAFCEGDQSGGPEAVSWALDRIENLQAEIERLKHAEATLNDMLNRQIDHTNEARTEIERLRAQLALTEKAGVAAEDEAGRHRATIERLTADLARAIEAGTTDQARADRHRDRLRACTTERLEERARTDALAHALRALVRANDGPWDMLAETLDDDDTREALFHEARQALAAVPKVTVVEDDTVPPDTIEMQVYGRRVLVKNVAPPKEDDA